MIGIRTHGSFKATTLFLTAFAQGDPYRGLERFGREGVNALASATPTDTGRTANSWEYEVVRKAGKVGIRWYNTHVNNGANIAILIQYGHGTGTGGYVTGRDYINPAIQPIFDKIADEVWKEVTK